MKLRTAIRALSKKKMSTRCEIKLILMPLLRICKELFKKTKQKKPKKEQ